MNMRSAYYDEERIAPSIREAAVHSRGGIDVQFLILTIMLLGFGLFSLFSASYPTEYFQNSDNNAFSMILRQVAIGGGGLLVMFMVSYVRVTSLPMADESNGLLRFFSRMSIRKFAMRLMWAAIFLNIPNALIGAAIQWGGASLSETMNSVSSAIGIRTVNGATRWWGPLQPSELLKLGIIIGFSAIIGRERASHRHSRLPQRTGFLSGFLRLPFCRVCMFAALALGLMLCQSHKSGLIIILVITFVLLLTSGAIKMPLALTMIAIIVVGAVLYVGHVNDKWERLYGEYLVNRENGMTHSAAVEIFRKDAGSYFDKRIMAWQHPDFDTQGISYQVNQSLLAVGSGGLLGQGFGKSRQKFFHLPEAENDYIFAVVCEESGFIGAVLILILFALLIARGFWIALHARDKFSALVVIGIMTMLAIQVVFNVGVVTNLLPPTGISLPFFSQGGTALVVQLVEMGIILSVSRDMSLTRRG